MVYHFTWWWTSSVMVYWK